MVNINMNDETYMVADGIKSGVYTINYRVNDVISEDDKTLYVGKATNINKRKSDHLNLLRNNKHYNSELQEFYNMVGEERLYFRHALVENNLLKFGEQFMMKIESMENNILNSNRVINTKVTERDPVKAKLHSKRMSKRMSGQNNPNSKLTEVDAKNILDMKDRGVKIAEIAEVFDISINHVHRIGKTRWKCVV